ncbi:MAG: hypothetical protein Q4C72_02400 [Eubacteriales bacterium]|nr:hypothetical protein [Eubacteriales bacterium]
MEITSPAAGAPQPALKGRQNPANPHLFGKNGAVFIRRRCFFVFAPPQRKKIPPDRLFPLDLKRAPSYMMTSHGKNAAFITNKLHRRKIL